MLCVMTFALWCYGVLMCIRQYTRPAAGQVDSWHAAQGQGGQAGAHTLGKTALHCAAHTSNVQAVEVLSRASECSSRERDLIKAVPDTELTSAMIGNVKVAVAGLQKLKTAQRKAKSQGR